MPRRACGMYPMAGLPRRGARPSTRISPASGRSRPRAARRSVVLPAPLAPSTPTKAPSGIANSRSDSTGRRLRAEADAAEGERAGRSRLVHGRRYIKGFASALTSVPTSALPARASFTSLSWPANHACTLTPLGSVSVTPTTGTCAALAIPQQPIRGLVRDLLVVEQDPSAAVLQALLEGDDLRRAWLGVVHHRDLERLVQHGEAQRLGHVAEHGLGGRHPGALVRGGDGAGGGRDLLERDLEGVKVAFVIGRMGRVALGEFGRQAPRPRPAVSWGRTTGGDCRRSWRRSGGRATMLVRSDFGEADSSLSIHGS